MNGNNARRIVVPAIGRALRETHDGVDQAIGSGALLIAKMMEMRATAGINGTAVQAELETMLDGLAGLGRVRAAYIEVHSALNSLGRDNGLITGEGVTHPKGFFEAENLVLELAQPG